MRKLNLKSYEYSQTVRNPITGQSNEMKLNYSVKDSVLNILFLPALRLMGAALVKQNVLAIKIETCEKDEIELNEDEWKLILAAVNAYPAQGRMDVEFIDRILNQTPEVI